MKDKTLQPDETARFTRLIEEWGVEVQDRVTESTTTIFGDGHIGRYTASFLASAGFGNIRYVSNSKLSPEETHFWAIPLEGRLQAYAFESALPQLNPNVHICGMKAEFESDFLMSQILSSDVLIDATNSPDSKAWVLQMAMDYNLPAISIAGNDEEASFRVFDPRNPANYDHESIKLSFKMDRYAGAHQDEIIGRAIAGLADEEAKKFVIRGTTQKPEAATLENELTITFPNRPSPEELKQLKVLQIGAGASGNKAAYALTKLGIGQLDIVDSDDITTHNFPRTELLIGRYGEQKSDVLVENLSKLFPNTNLRSFVTEFGRTFSGGRGYHAIIDCVDNDHARGEAYHYAIKQGLPHLSVGTSFNGFNTALAIPNKTACMFHYFPDLEQEAKLSLARIRNGCEHTAPSNSWMQVGADIGVLQLVNALVPSNGTPIMNGIFKYDAKRADRLRALQLENTCDCYTK